MTETATPSDIVASFVENHALADKYLAKAYRAAMRMAVEVEAGLEIGMVTNGLEAKEFLAGHRTAPGKIAEVALFLAALHSHGTELAKANGVDLGKIKSVGGVDLPQPDFETMDGGR
jgi:hypothetical protein